MASVTLWPYSAEILFLFRICRGLRAAPNAFSREETLAINGIRKKERERGRRKI